MNTETTPAKTMRERFSDDAATLAAIRVQLCDLVELLALRHLVAGDRITAKATKHDASMALACLAEVEQAARRAGGRPR